MDSENVSIGYLLKRTQAALRQAMDEALREQGLSMAQYAALSALTGDGDLTNAELARRCFVTPQTMIRIVANLDDDGWISRRQDPANARRILNAITDDGRARIDESDAAVAAIDDRMLTGLSRTERAEFDSYLRRCLHNLEA